MRKFTAVIVFSTCSLFFQESAFASGMRCLNEVRLAYVNVGFTDNSNYGGGSPENGNTIYVGYYVDDSNISATHIRVNSNINLNDGNKGLAMYHGLTTALALGLKVSAWDHDFTIGATGTCDDFDEIRFQVPN